MIEQLRTAVEALAAPKPIDEHTPDPRPAPLRRAHALAEILHRHLTAGAGPRDGGVRPQVVVTVALRDLLGRLHETAAANAKNVTATGATATDAAATDAAGPTGGASHGGPGAWGSAWSDYDGIQTAAMARMLACDAAIIPQVLGSDSVVLDQGRAIRLFTAAQRRAITTRDRGCGFPGCDIPPAWTDAHHITYWSLGGATDTANGVLLCRRHHTEIHQGHWRIQTDPRGGRPWFVPPPHIDPGRKPRRNNHFHFPDLVGAVDRR